MRPLEHIADISSRLIVNKASMRTRNHIISSSSSDWYCRRIAARRLSNYNVSALEMQRFSQSDDDFEARVCALTAPMEALDPNLVSSVRDIIAEVRSRVIKHFSSSRNALISTPLTRSASSFLRAIR